MALSSCARCKKLFLKVRSNLCLACETLEEDQYDIVRQHVSQNPHDNAEKVSGGTGISIETILRFITDGRIAVQGATSVACGKCGKPAISASKKLCNDCLQTLNKELAQQSSRISLPAKKEPEIGKTLKTFTERS